MEKRTSILPPIKKLTWSNDLAIIPLSNKSSILKHPLSDQSNTARERKLSTVYLPSLVPNNLLKTRFLNDYLIARSRRLSMIYERPLKEPMKLESRKVIKPYSPFPKREAERIINSNVKKFIESSNSDLNYFDHKPIDEAKQYLMYLSENIKHDVKAICDERYRIAHWVR